MKKVFLNFKTKNQMELKWLSQTSALTVLFFIHNKTQDFVQGKIVINDHRRITGKWRKPRKLFWEK